MEVQSFPPRSESDLLFRARAGDHVVAFHLLFEHQTTEDPDLALRLPRDMVRIRESQRGKSPANRQLIPRGVALRYLIAPPWGLITDQLITRH